MARKKQEVALQLEINTQEEWEELMQKEGLLIVDVYQDWCGPCKAVLSFLRRMKNEIGDDILQFAIAKSDTIDSLDKYRGRCEPCFLIYGGGSLVSVIRGANPPVLEETIKSKLEEEHKVMKGEIERKEIKDPYLADMDVEEKIENSEKDTEEIEQEITLALIKPDVVKAGKVDEILSKLNERGIEILAKQERNLTEEEAKSFYHHMESSEYFDKLIKFLTSGPSYILVLAKGDEGIIHEFKELIGPKVFEEAKEKAPESFRAIYGSNSIENAIHGADDKESVHRELAFFFPDFVTPKISRKKQEVSHQQRTLALIRPAAFTEFKDSILEKIEAAGFKISMQKEVKLNKEDAELFYKDHKGRPYFDDLTTEMSNGTLLALALEKDNAIGGFRGILGPKSVEKAKESDPSSLRAQFSKENIAINLIHGSDSEETAQNELKYFFPVEHTIAAIKPDGMENREEIINKIKEAQFKIVKTLDIVMTKELAEEFYADQKDEEYFEDLIVHMQSGPTLFMVLSREDAIRGWRSLMGPKDPNIAAESYADSIRSIYGKDIKENAVYGSSDEKEVSRVMEIIFGKLEFFEDGSLLPQYITPKEESSKEEVDTQEKSDDKPADSLVNDEEQVETIDVSKSELEGDISVQDDSKQVPEDTKLEIEGDISVKEDSKQVSEESERVIKEIEEEEVKTITVTAEADTEETLDSLKFSKEKSEITTDQIKEKDLARQGEQQENNTDQDQLSSTAAEKSYTTKEDMENSKVDKIKRENSSEVVQNETIENLEDNNTEKKVVEQEFSEVEKTVTSKAEETESLVETNLEEDSNTEQNVVEPEFSEVEKTVTNEAQEPETLVETNIESNENKEIKEIENTISSAKREEETLVEETLITNDLEEVMIDKEEETLLDEINIGTDIKDDNLKDKTEDNVITETENDELNVETKVDDLETETGNPGDLDNAGTVPEVEEE